MSRVVKSECCHKDMRIVHKESTFYVCVGCNQASDFCEDERCGYCHCRNPKYTEVGTCAICGGLYDELISK